MQYLEGLREREATRVERLAQLHCLNDRGRVGDEQPSRSKRSLRVLDHLPPLRQVEHHAVEGELLDALVAVAELYSILRGGIVADEAADVRRRPRCEVLTKLVADD